MKDFFLIILTIITSVCYSQNKYPAELNLTNFDSLTHKKIYRIEISSNQILELIEYNERLFEGSLYNIAWQINKKSTESKLIFQKITIKPFVVNKFIRKFEINNIEHLRSCEEIKECITGLDGTSIGISIYTRNTNKYVWFWEPLSDYYYKTSNIFSEIISIRKYFEIINTEFDINKSFGDFLNRLPKGIYTFRGSIIFTKL